MTDILFLQNTISEFQGVMYLSRKLKDAGYRTHLLISNAKNIILNYIDNSNIKVVCFSLLYGHQFWAAEISRMLKTARPSLKILWGGIFTTFNVDYLLEIDCVDAFCVGEGDETIVPLIESVMENKKPEKVSGAVFIRDGTIQQNPIADYVDLNTVTPDRDLYFSYSAVLRNNPAKIFVCSRGCIGDCSYCYNSKMKDVYKNNPGPYLRWRNPDYMIEEIRYVKKKYGMKRIFFYDDIFNFNKRWSFEFLPKFKTQINVPYMCYTRADMVDEEIIALFKETGCYMLSFGIETGNEALRSRILNKRVTNEKIRKSAEVIKRAGLHFNTTNMMGFPNETYSMGLETIELNIKIGAVGSCNILNPFPGTKLYDYCRENNLFEERYFKDERAQIHYYPMIKNPDREALGNLERLFQLSVFFPCTMYPLVKKIARWKPNILFDMIFLFMQFFYIKFITEKYSLGFMARYYSEKFRAVFRHNVE